MKQISLCILMVVGIVFSFLGCSNKAPSNIESGSSQGAVDVVEKFFSTNTEFSLEQLLYCKPVDIQSYRQTEKEWAEEVSKENYAYSLVQTDAIITCRKTGALGNEGERIHLGYLFYLVKINSDSEWKIVEFGYPGMYPYYQGSIIDCITVEKKSFFQQTKKNVSIETFSTIIEILEKTEKNHEQTTKESDWEVRIILSGVDEHTILLLDNKICIDDTWYCMSDEDAGSLQEICKFSL